MCRSDTFQVIGEIEDFILNQPKCQTHISSNFYNFKNYTYIIF
jgi:hypothetical protein